MSMVFAWFLAVIFQNYTAKAIFMLCSIIVGIAMSLIYHLVTTTRWQDWPSDQPYLPAEYANDGFVHCTAGDELMIAVANRFYQQVPGDFLLLVIESERLTSPLKWEAPSPGDTLAPLFPHIYGPINRDAVVATKTITRASDGRFLTIA